MLAGKKVKAIVAMSENRVIGKNNSLPWHLPEDLKNFSKLTSGHAVVMGRKTFESLPEKFRPLPNRLNIVLTRSNFTTNKTGVVVVNGFDNLEKIINEKTINLPSDEIWIIGGALVYEASSSLWDELFLTFVNGNFEGDAFLPELEKDFKLISEEVLPWGSFRHYVK